VAEYQRVIDEIRFQLQSSDCELTDDLRQLASSYSAACRSVNQRLRRCGEFLRLGLRSEAIQFAEEDSKHTLMALFFSNRLFARTYAF